MPAAVPIIAGVGGVSSLLGSVLSGKPKQTTQTSSYNNSSTSTPTFTPEGQKIQQQLLGYSDQLLRDPSAGTSQIRQAGLNTINNNYDQLPGQISQQLASRGFGKSGQLGQGLYSVANDRLNTLSNYQAQMNKFILDRQSQGAALGQDLLSANRGTTSTQSGSSTGTGTQPGSMAANGLLSAGNGLSNLSTLLMLQKVLGGGGGGGGFSEGPGVQNGSLPTDGHWGDYGGEF